MCILIPCVNEWKEVVHNPALPASRSSPTGTALADACDARVLVVFKYRPSHLDGSRGCQNVNAPVSLQ